MSLGDPMALFAAWLTVFSIAFTFLPLAMVQDWRRRSSAEGFSSVNFVLPLLMMFCWLRFGLMTGDVTNIIINTVNIAIFAGYIFAFAYYQPERKYLVGQLLALTLTILAIFRHVDQQPIDQAPDAMAGIAAFTQIAGLFGGIYEIKRAISLGTTEYLDAKFQYGMFLLLVQWTIFGFLTHNLYIAYANAAGLIVNVITIGLYFVYPPRTWRVPFIGTGPTEKKID